MSGRIRGCHPLWPAFPDRSAYNTETTGLLRFRSPLLAESLLMSVPPGTEMFQFPGFASPAYVFSWRYSLRSGLPHSDIHGSTPARGSPWLFAACHVLHRLLVPRHPPNALVTLDHSPGPSRAYKTRQGPHHAQEPPPDEGPPKTRRPTPDALRAPSTQHTHFLFTRHRRTSHPPCRSTPVRYPTVTGGWPPIAPGWCYPPVGQKRDRTLGALPLTRETRRTPGRGPERPARSGARRGAPEPDSRW